MITKRLSLFVWATLLTWSSKSKIWGLVYNLERTQITLIILTGCVTFDSCVSLSGFLIKSRIQAAATDLLNGYGQLHWAAGTGLNSPTVCNSKWSFEHSCGNKDLCSPLSLCGRAGRGLSSKGMGPVVIPCNPGVPNYGQVCQETFGPF